MSPSQDLWISYHTRNASMIRTDNDEDRPLAVKATAAAGILVSGVVKAVTPPLVLSYVTTAAAGHKAIMHVHSASASLPLRSAAVFFVSASGSRCSVHASVFCSA